ncbi:MAG: hypothetical protein Q27BB25_12745 [Blastomonas sp. CACIA14H2]|uniref:hypothetical protein n=1 Tax=unclassified Blastomonas TaxID=2626550 RepID=UPI0003CFAB9E|nr:MAG: hypothetical protein Q27BB25_12745 [Blastomonas sp. CACIA14H2]
MLKEVMLGSGGIMLAAAIFASSVNTGPVPAGAPGAAPVAAPPVVTPPPSEAVVTPPPPPLPEDTGDVQFGAPMISTKPVAEVVAEPQPIVTDPDSAVANGGRQYNAHDTPHNYPIPK